MRSRNQPEPRRDRKPPVRTPQKRQAPEGYLTIEEWGREVGHKRTAAYAAPLDLANRQPAGVEADDPVVKALDPGLALGDNLRLKAAVAVAWHRQLDRPVIAD